MENLPFLSFLNWKIEISFLKLENGKCMFYDWKMETVPPISPLYFGGQCPLGGPDGHGPHVIIPVPKDG